MKIADNCVYTIIHSNTVQEMINGEEKLIIKSQLPWTKAVNNFKIAKKNNEQFYCIIAPAEDTKYLLAFGIIKNITYNKKQNNTKCELVNISYFKNKKIKKNILKLTSSNTNLSENFIKTYANCYTSSIEKYLIPDSSNNKIEKKVIPSKTKSEIIRFNRNSKIKENVLKRAKDKCELCNSKAPFIKNNGEPYFEIHHLIPLAEGGLDTESNTTCLCPNCHKELHYGEEAKKKTKLLLKRIKLKQN